MQGQSRRIRVEVRSVPDSGTMPLMAECVLSVQVGNVEVQPASQVSYRHTMMTYSYRIHKPAVHH